MHVKEKLIEFCCCEISELCFHIHIYMVEITKTDERTIRLQPICFSIMLILRTRSNLGVFNQQ